MSSLTTRLSRENIILPDPTSDYDDSNYEETRIQWSNLIFLPFHPSFRVLVLIAVIHKCILGPIQSVYPIVHCWDVMDENICLSLLKFFYWHCGDIIYVIDTFLHIVHRQVTDKAMRREFLPKSAFLIILDILAVIPFFGLSTDICDAPKLWPNVLAFSEFLVIYRVVEYYSLLTSHSFCNLIIGFTIILLCTMNCLTCFWVLLTKHGLCANCKEHIYDWRQHLFYKFNQSSEDYSTYVYGMAFVSSYTYNEILDDVVPSTIVEFISTSIIVVLGYFLWTFILLPKTFAEIILRLRGLCTNYPIIQRLVEETKRRNPFPKAYIKVENFYSTMWKKRSGVTHIPEILQELPRYLRVEIRQDLIWPLFYHSPNLRRASMPFKRWLCETAILDFKLPGEKFFAGPHTHTNVYYLKSGVVQILSGDEGITPVISVTSGTIFGDISFLVPPLKRKVILKCLTYCEVIFLTRKDFIKALYKYPDDRRRILQLANERMKHAKALYSCKQLVRGLDRAEDEGIAWVKRKWWEISDSLTTCKRKSRKDHKSCDLPLEDTAYHCPKYIGQLVLCNETQLLTKSMFVNVQFPWILSPQSAFYTVWYKIVCITIFFVLLLYPPNLTKSIIPTWFRFFQVWTDLVYSFDICISLLTSLGQSERSTSNFASVMFARGKTLNFHLDLLATIWIELIVVAIGQPQYYEICQFNRVIKIYMLYTGFINWNVMKNPMLTVYFRLIMTYFCFLYLSAFIFLAITELVPGFSKRFYFGKIFCGHVAAADRIKDTCITEDRSSLYVVISWTMSFFFNEEYPRTLLDSYLLISFAPIIFYLKIYGLSLLVAAIYLKLRDTTNFQNYVSNLKKYYKNYKIHPDLLKRLDKYLICHWKYYQGADIMHPHILKNEPYDIYWKVQGEIAEKVIGESRAFLGADPALIRDLAFAAKFLILPKNSTLFLFGVQCQNVTWVVHGSIKCEYLNENGELVKVYYKRGCLLSVGTVFLGKASFRTYTTSTDCETLYIKRSEFLKIIKQYPTEWSNLDRCIFEFSPIFQDLFYTYVRKHMDYQNRLKDRMLQSRKSTVGQTKSVIEAIDFRPTMMLSPDQHDFWSEPEYEFVQIWMPFRMIIAIVSMFNASVQGGSGVVWRTYLILVGAFCDCITWIDIILKLFLAYYDERGILITSKRKCLIHYLMRGFLLDMIGALPWYEVLKLLLSEAIDDNMCLFINLFCKYAHLYIVLGYFDYLCDAPTINSAYLMIVKWQLVILLVMFAASHVLMSYCFVFEFNESFDLVQMRSRNTCWLPTLLKMPASPSLHEMHYAYADSLNLAQNSLMALHLGDFNVDPGELGVGLILLILMVVFWYAMGYSLTLLVLNSRGNTLFQHGVSQLRNFLVTERVENDIVERATAHFTYWWVRTKGINVHHLTSERTGVVFRQDLTYYFYEKTFLSLDTLLRGGENQGREMASISTQYYVLPGHDIIREMDLLAWVFVVHRGKIVISKDGQMLAVIGKGSIFGQLHGAESRPVRITAKAESHADVLQIGIKQFQEIINDKTRENIACHPTSNLDYMGTKKHFAENPYDSLQYILRGSKANIKLPWMKAPVEANHNSWYCRWLYIAWLVEPFMTALVWLTLKLVMEKRGLSQFYWFLVPLDCIALTNFVFEFFVVQLVVVDRECVSRVMGYRRLQHLGIYIDFLALAVPAVAAFTDYDVLHLVRLLRLKNLFKFHFQFCQNFKCKVAPLMLKIVIIFLFLHFNTCGWIYVNCRSQGNLSNTQDYSERVNQTIDQSQWVHPKDRPGGCARLFWPIVEVTGKPRFLVPRNWKHDYIVVMSFIMFYYTRTGVQVMACLSIGQVYYKLVVTFFMYLIYMWVMSVTISFVYTRFRELYLYDYGVDNLITYLKCSGLSPALLRSVRIYTNQLWRRQRGNWMPELVQQAPLCLREDLMSALYMHHLETPPMFRGLPLYFRRQLVARFKRTVIFPGKTIVQEGDCLPVIYFIHEGEVEKWYVDTSGETRMVSLLTTNSFFGQIPGMFPNVMFQFSYVTRTVADLITLCFWDWQDLLNGYPDIKRELYKSATLLKKNYKRA